MKSEFQKGVTLIITFLIMTTMLGITLSVSSIIFSKVNIMMNIEDSLSAFYAADRGAEEALYFDRKQIPHAANRGFCSICDVCADSANCSECSATSLTQDGTNGCDKFQCTNCEISYKTTFPGGLGRKYNIKAKVVPDSDNPNVYLYTVNSKGFYKNTSRAIEVFSKLSQ